MEEVKRLIAEQGKAFEEFKKANDERLKALAEGKSVSELEEKVASANKELDRLGKALEEVAKKANRPGASGEDDQIHAEHKAAWDKYARKGHDAGLADLEAKAINVGTPGEGGYAMPIEQDREILRLLRNESPMRQVCRIITTGSGDYRKVANTGGTQAGWVGEAAPRPETGTPGFAELKPFMGEIYANPGVTQTALDDLFFDVGAEISTDIVEAFAEQEGAAFVSGDGNNKPKGLLAYPKAATDDRTRSFGTIQTIASGVADNIVDANVLSLIYGLKKGYRSNASFMMNGNSLHAFRKIKDNNGNYIWQPSFQAGQPATLAGYGVVENEDMPDIGAGATPIAFGDFKRAYYIVDRIGIRTLRDALTNKPYVHFYTTKRVGGMLADSAALKLLLIAA
jgi:HK97 family phage major capsid protein